MAQPEARSASIPMMLDEFSLEMTGKDVPSLYEASGLIPPGTKINVTFLGNEDLEMRVGAAKAVKELGFVPVPHISARRLRSQEQLEEFLGRLHEVGASERVFAVGGDPAVPEGPYPDALTLIESGVFAQYGVREVSVAGYPEGHPDISNETLWSFLQEKSRALTEQQLQGVVLTQFGFDSDPMVEWIGQVRSRGIDSVIRIGVPGPTSVKRLLSFARRFGISANAMVVKKYGFSLGNLIGTAGPEKLVAALAGSVQGDASLGRVKLHFYTFGGLAATARWAQQYVPEQH